MKQILLKIINTHFNSCLANNIIHLTKSLKCLMISYQFEYKYKFSLLQRKPASAALFFEVC